MHKRTGLIVDSFAGGGGASTGIFMALGKHPDVAINHDAEAIAMHTANHPESRHFCENVWKVNPTDVADVGGVELLWASPDCKHFSKAKGGKPVEKGVRGLAWLVVLWAKLVLPRIIMLENVEEFQTWGPLLPDDRPNPKKRGLTFKQWVGRLKAHGYVVEWRELKACDYGAPTSRKRLFVIARRDGQPIVWPEPTHGPAKTIDDEPRVRDLFAPPPKKLKPYRTAAECIDWSLPCPSIFSRKRPLAEKTLARIARGLKRFVIDNPQPFIVPFIIKAKTNGWDRDDSGMWPGTRPLPTVITSDLYAVVAPTLIQTGYGEREGQAPRSLDLHAPLGTVVAGGAKHALVAAFLAKHYGGGYTGPGVDLADPISTITTVDHHAVVTAELAPSCTRDDEVLVHHDDDDDDRVVDDADDDDEEIPPYPPEMIDQPGDSRAVRARKKDARWFHIVKHQDSKRIDDEIAASSLVVLRNNCDGADVEEPAPTVTAGGTHIGEVRAFLVRYFGNEKAGQRLDDPMSTVTTRDRFGLVTVDGVDHVIVDIGMRMLTARELANAQGFPPDYDLSVGGTLSKTAQIRMIGNSVVPQLAEAIVRANVTITNEPISEAA